MKLIADYLLGIVTVFQEAEGEPYEGKVAVADIPEFPELAMTAQSTGKGRG